MHNQQENNIERSPNGSSGSGGGSGGGLQRHQRSVGSLMSLSDDLIGRILFSGYISICWSHNICLMLVCKGFMNLAKKYLTYVDNSGRVVLDRNTLKYINLSPVLISKYAPNVLYLNFATCQDSISIDSEFGEMLVQLRNTLRYLSLRSLPVNDQFIISYITQLKLLQYLDLSNSKADRREMITDMGGNSLMGLIDLRWIGLCMTSISDVTIITLQKNCPNINHFHISGCHNITNYSFEYIRQWKLVSLEITNCRQLDMTALNLLFDQR
jgi:hypothetical protein